MVSSRWFLLEILVRDLDSPLEVEHRIGIKSYDFMNFFLFYCEL